MFSEIFNNGCLLSQLNDDVKYNENSVAENLHNMKPHLLNEKKRKGLRRTMNRDGVCEDSSFFLKEIKVFSCYIQEISLRIIYFIQFIEISN